MTRRTRRRPAEAGGAGLASIVAAFALLTGVEVSTQQLAAIVLIVGWAPAAITTTVVFFRDLLAKSTEGGAA